MPNDSDLPAWREQMAAPVACETLVSSAPPDDAPVAARLEMPAPEPIDPDFVRATPVQAIPAEAGDAQPSAEPAPDAEPDANAEPDASAPEPPAPDEPADS